MPDDDAALTLPLPPREALVRALAGAADLCRQPLRHAVILPEDNADACEELGVRIEARTPDGTRQPEADLDLEIYRSGAELNVMIGWCALPERPLLWHGRHPVWMDAASGQRCERPEDGPPLEALARRLRALLLS